jgi:hypothetical protein
MKQIFNFLFGLVLTFSAINPSWSQDRFAEEFTSVKKELTDWDPVRGEWLANSMVAMAQHEAIPTRTFPEDLTPMEMLRLIPPVNQEAIREQINGGQGNATETTTPHWNLMHTMINRTICSPRQGRSYGDPHLSSFDGASYSFQTVGEFVMARSRSGRFEVQSRQQPQSDDFSLNTAIAMNVDGDRVAIYAMNKPDNNTQTALRINGEAMTMVRDVYFLPHGGTVRYSNRAYTITWPTGEVVKAELRGSVVMSFINVSVQIFPCSGEQYEGLLGNANGIDRDDFETGIGTNRPAYMSFSSFGNDQMQQASNQMEKEYLAFLARDFARVWRITPATTLFDYTPGESTLTYTDETFPRVHRTINDLTPSQQATARKACEENGVSNEDMRGCVYDQAYLSIPGTPRPPIHDRTTGLTLERIEGVVRNDNNGVVINPVKQERGEGTPQAQPIGQQQGAERNTEQERKVVTPQTQQTQERPVQERPVQEKPVQEKPIQEKPVQEKPVQTPIQINNGGSRGSGTPTNTTPTTPAPQNRGGGGGTAPAGTAPVRTTPTIKPGKG